jgi:hypothetical protein
MTFPIWSETGDSRNGRMHIFKCVARASGSNPLNLDQTNDLAWSLSLDYCVRLDFEWCEFFSKEYRDHQTECRS